MLLKEGGGQGRACWDQLETYSPPFWQRALTLPRFGRFRSLIEARLGRASHGPPNRNLSGANVLKTRVVPLLSPSLASSRRSICPSFDRRRPPSCRLQPAPSAPRLNWVEWVAASIRHWMEAHRTSRPQARLPNQRPQ